MDKFEGGVSFFFLNQERCPKVMMSKAGWGKMTSLGLRGLFHEEAGKVDFASALV